MKATEEEYHQNQALVQGQELDIIKRMIEKTKADTASSGRDFIMWGWLVFSACVFTYLFVFWEREEWTWLPWAVLMPIGAIASVVSGMRQMKKVRVVSYTTQALASLWQACGLTIFVVAFLALPLGAVSLDGLVPMISIIAGIGTFVTGGIIEWKLVRWSGVAWWIAAISMMFIHWHYHSLVMAITIFPGYLIPGYALRKKFLER